VRVSPSEEPAPDDEEPTPMGWQPPEAETSDGVDMQQQQQQQQ
jgi:hypothetical protein